MFTIFKGKANYEEIFSSASDTHQYLYGNRAKTADILGNEEFIDAWLASNNSAQVTMIINKEALNGDIPSIKQMIWLNHLYYTDAENLTDDKEQQMKIKIDSLKNRVRFCQKAIDLGLKEQSYYAMVSSANLYSLLAPRQISITDELTIKTLNGIVDYARQFIASGQDDPELLQDAKNLLKQFEHIAKLTNALNSPQPREQIALAKEPDIRSVKKITITREQDIQSLLEKHGMTEGIAIVRDMAIKGNLFCQKFLSGAGLCIPEKDRTSKINQDIEKFTRLAAEGGDKESQFNLALLYIKKIDVSRDTFSEQDMAFLQQAKYWHQKAAAQRFLPSIQALENIKNAFGDS